MYEIYILLLSLLLLWDIYQYLMRYHGYGPSKSKHRIHLSLMHSCIHILKVIEFLVFNNLGDIQLVPTLDICQAEKKTEIRLYVQNA